MRPTISSLRIQLVHRRLRYAQSEAGYSVARRTGLKVGHAWLWGLMSQIGLQRQAAFFGPTVANWELRTWLDRQLAPPSRD